jgi:hypothetical protein
MYKAAFIVNLQLIQPFPKPWYGGSFIAPDPVTFIYSINFTCT